MMARSQRAGSADLSSTEQCLRLRFDRFEIDEADARLTDSGTAVRLAPKAFAVLCALARTPGLLVTKRALLDRIWPDRFVTEAVLKSAISGLRAALGDDPKQPRVIETVSRRGYRFIAPVEARETPMPAEAVASSQDALARLGTLARRLERELAAVAEACAELRSHFDLGRAPLRFSPAENDPEITRRRSSSKQPQ